MKTKKEKREGKDYVVITPDDREVLEEDYREELDQEDRENNKAIAKFQAEITRRQAMKVDIQARRDAI